MKKEQDAVSVIEVARRVIGIEVTALEGLRESIGEDFHRVVTFLAQAEGRLVVTGVGKSAIIAQKMTATFNSTGTPAVYLHAADAVHGDMGMIQPGDVLLYLSKSGDNEEAKALVPSVRARGNWVVGIVANATSWLARHADMVLHTPVLQEADPHNLAPTASAVIQMALGDALAVCLSERRGFTARDFAHYHPGGVLGKKLYLRVGDLCHRDAPPVVMPAAGVQEVILEITTKRLGCAVVIEPGVGAVHGIITDGDLRRMLERHRVDGWGGLRAVDIMTRGPQRIGAEELAVQALVRMRECSITQLVVMEGGRFVGVLHLHDLLREGIA
ncbi:MAG: hypothetical protein RLY31_467 [Bacteroidota bacterium]